MNTFIQFVNRKNELNFLENQVARKGAFIVIYGRRRVGKSELIKHFIKNKKAVYLLSTQEVEKEIIASFSIDLADFFEDTTLKVNPFSQFTHIMEYLKDKDLNGMILAIDEFPYLVDANKAIPSIIQKYWDTYLKTKGLTLILCGSSIGAMETEVLGRKSPLYGRRTGQWKVEPLPFQNFIQFFPDCSFERLVELYSLSGGIPLYTLELDGKKTSYQNAETAIAARGALLYQEADMLMREEVREPKTYFSLLKEISIGKNTMNDLSIALGVERTALVRYLDTLMELDLIAATKPITSKEKSKNTLYVLKDNYLRFWFKFVYPFKKDLDSFQNERFKRNFDLEFNSYLGRQFETVCRQALELKNPIGLSKTGQWWGAYRENEERKTAEIDIVAINEETDTILFGECKWKERVSVETILNDLKDKTRHVDWRNHKRKEYFAIFAKSFKNKKETENVFLYDLNDLEAIFRKKSEA